MISKKDIKSKLSELNSVENQNKIQGAESTIKSIDLILADTWEGWANGVHSPSRESEREKERAIFTMLPDYNRVFDLIIIDPPFASVSWTLTGTAVTNDFKVKMQGVSLFEFNDEGIITKSWLHSGQTPTPSELGIDT